MGTIAYAQWRSTSDVPGTIRDAVKVVEDEFGPIYNKLKQIIDVDLKSLEQRLEDAGAPYTPGRLPVWKKK